RQPPCRRLRNVGELALASPEGEAGTLPVHVEAGREVDLERQPFGQAAVLRREPHRARLAFDGARNTRERADLARPDARAADDDLGGNGALARLDRDDPAVAYRDARRRAPLPH